MASLKQAGFGQRARHALLASGLALVFPCNALAGLVIIGSDLPPEPMVLDQSAKYNVTIEHENLHAVYGQWEYENPSMSYTNGTITMEKYFFDLANIHAMEEPPKPEEEKPMLLWPWILLAVLAAAVVIGFLLYRRRKKKLEEDK